MAPIDPTLLSRYRVTQLVDLCKARDVGTAAPSDTADDSQSICSTFQSMIHGYSEGQANSTSTDVPQASIGGVFGYRNKIDTA